MEDTMKKHLGWMIAALMSFNLASAFADDAATDEEEATLPVEEEQVVAVVDDNSDVESE